MKKSNNTFDSKFSFMKVEKQEFHMKILYEIIKKRKKNISHKIIPKFSDHKDFVMNHPYRVWYLIKQDDEFIGSTYILRNNCVGINIIKNKKSAIFFTINEILRRHKPLKTIKSVRAAEFDFNCAPTDAEYISILHQMGAKISQITFVFKTQ